MAGWLCVDGDGDDVCSALVVQPALGNTMVMGFMVSNLRLSLAGDVMSQLRAQLLRYISDDGAPCCSAIRRCTLDFAWPRRPTLEIY
jgi:hypothetical protein